MALRDDSNKLSLSVNERHFTRTCKLNGTNILRQDGREPGETRKIRSTFSRSHSRSECTVELGNTKCLCCIAADLVPPNLDKPNNGILNFQANLSPMASLSYESGLGSTDSSQRILSTKIGRLMERIIREGNALDTEALCVQSGKWVWCLNIDVTVLDDSGNVLDAALLAVISALRHFRLPEVSYLDDDTPVILHSDDKEPTPLPLHHSPVCITFGLFGDRTGSTDSSKVATIVDPTNREQLVMDGSITFALNRHKELCALDFNGGCEIKTTQLFACAKLAEKKGKELCEMLEESLTKADSEAKEERLNRLKTISAGSSSTMLDQANTPYVESSDPVDMEVENLENINEIGAALAKAAAEDEKYRLQALDYDLGHVAAKVKDDTKEKKDTPRTIGGGNLMQAMIESANNIEGNVAMKENSVKPVTNDQKEELSNRITTDEKKVVKKETTPDSDDEEEGTTLLQSEFLQREIEPIKKTPKMLKGNPAKAPKILNDTPAEIKDEDDIDDLMLAIKKPKSKKGKKKKKQ